MMVADINDDALGCDILAGGEAGPADILLKYYCFRRQGNMMCTKILVYT